MEGEDGTNLTVAHGQVSDGEASAVINVTPMMDTGDFRAQIPVGDRQKIVDEIMDILKRDVPFIGPEGLQKIRQDVIEMEKNFYAAATTQSDFVERISLELARREKIEDDHMIELLKTNVGYTDVQMENPESVRPMDAGDWRDQVRASYRLKVIIWIINVLRKDCPFIPQAALEEIKNIAVKREETEAASPISAGRPSQTSAHTVGSSTSAREDI